MAVVCDNAQMLLFRKIPREDRSHGLTLPARTLASHVVGDRLSGEALTGEALTTEQGELGQLAARMEIVVGRRTQSQCEGSERNQTALKATGAGDT